MEIEVVSFSIDDLRCITLDIAIRSIEQVDIIASGMIQVRRAKQWLSPKRDIVLTFQPQLKVISVPFVTNNWIVNGADSSEIWRYVGC